MFSVNDANQILQKCISDTSKCEVFCDSIVVSETFIKECATPFDKIMASKADQVSIRPMCFLFEKMTKHNYFQELIIAFVVVKFVWKNMTYSYYIFS